MKEKYWTWFFMSMMVVIIIESIGKDSEIENYQNAMIEAYNAYFAAIEARPEITKPGCKEVLAACEFERPASYLRTGR